MDPFRYRKAYEAMIHASHLIENRFGQESGGSLPPDNVDSARVATKFEQEDPDSMEWTPTDTSVAPAGCGPLPTAVKSMRHLLSNANVADVQIEEKGKNTILLHKLQEGIIMDECIDKLVRDLPDVLSHDSSNAFVPSTIEVPKDFALQLSISINHHLAQVADRKILEKYRRLLGHRRAPSKKKAIKLGFDPIELMKRQAVSLPEGLPSTVSTLDNEIHPVFRPDNFHGCSDDIYDVLKPALRLSTLLLFSRATSPFWHTLVFGDRKPCSETTKAYSQPCTRIREDVAWSQDHAAEFRRFIDEQIDTVHFMFHRDPLPPDPAYASMGLVADYKNGLMRKLDRKCHASRICLHADFYTTAKKLSLLQYPDPAMVLRFNLFLAVCLAHEMSHFIEVSGPHHEHPLGEPEVFLHDNMWTESGIAFELKVFGGRLHPISSRVDCSLGLAVLSYPLREVYDKEDNILYTLPMDYVSRLQQKEIWEQDFSAASLDVFHVPRTGCRSIEVNGTNLMIWEDEKDAQISDHIDGRDTTFHRMDDGTIVRNAAAGGGGGGRSALLQPQPQRQADRRRWSPYGLRRTRPEEDDEAKSQSPEITESADAKTIPDEDAQAGASGSDQGDEDAIKTLDEDMAEETR